MKEAIRDDLSTQIKQNPCIIFNSSRKIRRRDVAYIIFVVLALRFALLIFHYVNIFLSMDTFLYRSFNSSSFKSSHCEM